MYTIFIISTTIIAVVTILIFEIAAEITAGRKTSKYTVVLSSYWFAAWPSKPRWPHIDQPPQPPACPDIRRTQRLLFSLSVCQDTTQYNTIQCRTSSGHNLRLHLFHHRNTALKRWLWHFQTSSVLLSSPRLRGLSDFDP